MSRTYTEAQVEAILADQPYSTCETCGGGMYWQEAHVCSHSGFDGDTAHSDRAAQRLADVVARTVAHLRHATFIDVEVGQPAGPLILEERATAIVRAVVEGLGVPGY